MKTYSFTPRKRTAPQRKAPTLYYACPVRHKLLRLRPVYRRKYVVEQCADLNKRPQVWRPTNITTQQFHALHRGVL